MVPVFILALSAALASEAHERAQKRRGRKEAWEKYILGISQEGPVDPAWQVELDRRMDLEMLPPGREYVPLPLRRGIQISVHRSVVDSRWIRSAHVTLLSSANFPSYRDITGEKRLDLLEGDVDEMADIFLQLLSERFDPEGLQFHAEVRKRLTHREAEATIRLSFVPEIETWMDSSGRYVTGVRKAWPDVEQDDVMGLLDEAKRRLNARGIFSMRPGWAFMHS